VNPATLSAGRLRVCWGCCQYLPQCRLHPRCQPALLALCRSASGPQAIRGPTQLSPAACIPVLNPASLLLSCRWASPTVWVLTRRRVSVLSCLTHQTVPWSALSSPRVLPAVYPTLPSMLRCCTAQPFCWLSRPVKLHLQQSQHNVNHVCPPALICPAQHMVWSDQPCTSLTLCISPTCTFPALPPVPTAGTPVLLNSADVTEHWTGVLPALVRSN
jgi:hypothetical protein